MLFLVVSFDTVPVLPAAMQLNQVGGIKTVSIYTHRSVSVLCALETVY